MKTAKNEKINFEIAHAILTRSKSRRVTHTQSQVEKQMQKAAKELDFVEAARLRDEIQSLKLML